MPLRRIGEIEIAGVDAVAVEEGFHSDELRLDRIAQRGCLLRNGRAAEKNHTGEQSGKHNTDDGKPQPVWCRKDAAEQVGEGVERHAEQHAGKDQKQRRSERPGKKHEACEGDGGDAANREGPGEVASRLKTIIRWLRHDSRFSLSSSLFRQKCPRSSRSGAIRHPEPPNERGMILPQGRAAVENAAKLLIRKSCEGILPVRTVAR